MLVSCILLLLAGVALLLFGRGMLASGARQLAARQMSAGAITRAEQWLTWSLWFHPGDGTTELMQAACCRCLQQEGGWIEAVQAAQRKGAPPRKIQQEIDLGVVRTGRMRNGAEKQLAALIEAGATPREVATAFVYGYLRREEPKRAKAWLSAFAVESPGDAQVAYLGGVYWRSQGKLERARAEFEAVLAKYPGHELARAALAEMAEEKDRLRQALEQYVEMATHSPACENAKVGMARILRKQGDIDNARVVVTPLAASPTPSSGVSVEMGEIELESGNYAAAKRWFEQVDLDEAKVGEATCAALMPFSLDGAAALAERLFAEVEFVTYRSKRADTLKVRLAIDSDDREATEELQRLPRRTGDVERNRSESPARSAADLYALYCSACHGENGDGNGRAARHLFPRPLNLRARGFRLVSTVNGVATLEDIEAVIRQGMPGTSMRSFETLTQQQQKLLAEEVLRLNRAGIRDQIVDQWRDEGEAIEEIEESEIRQEVELRSSPGKVVRAPQIGPADAEASARGKDTYVEFGCHQCHGQEGVGAADETLFDVNGHPTRPRDLVHEPLKGGPEPESLFLRILLGMPGSDHPACSSLSERQAVDLVQYCRSLARAPKRLLTNHQRSAYDTSRAYLAAFATAKTR
jgi:cytochrome c/tetratricopeptide (TPR) repeat protein